MRQASRIFRVACRPHGSGGAWGRLRGHSPSAPEVPSAPDLIRYLELSLPEAAEPSSRRPAGPLSGIRVLALEQMQALPFATQLLGRLGADVVKIEPPGRRARPRRPAVHSRPAGSPLGCDLPSKQPRQAKHLRQHQDPRGRQLVLDLAPRFDVVAENFGPGPSAGSASPSRTWRPSTRPASMRPSRFGSRDDVAVQGSSRLRTRRRSDVGDLRDEAPRGPATDGVASRRARRHRRRPLRERGDPRLVAPERDRTGQAQFVDVRDVRLCRGHDRHRVELLVPRIEERGHRSRHQPRLPRRRWLVHHSSWTASTTSSAWPSSSANRIGFRTPAWPLARGGWTISIRCFGRPLNAGRRTRPREEASATLASAGIAAGPCLRDDELTGDPHIAEHRMLVEHRPARRLRTSGPPSREPCPHPHGTDDARHAGPLARRGHRRHPPLRAGAVPR